MKTGLRLITNTIIRTGLFLISVIVALAMTPFIIHSLGDRSYGLWAIIGTIMGFYGFFDFGITTAVARYVSRAKAGNDSEEINRVLSNSLALFSALAGVILILTPLIIFCGRYFAPEPEDLNLFRRAVAILSIHIALGFPLRIFSGILKAHLRYDLFTYASLTKMIISNGAILYLLSRGHGILAMATATFAAHVVEYLLCVTFAFQVLPRFKLRRSMVNRKSMTSLLTYSSKTAIIEIANLLRLKLDFLVIGKMLGLSAVTPYAVGARLIDYFGELMGSLIGNLMPLFSRYEGSDDYPGIRDGLLTLIPFNTLFAISIGGSILFHGEAFIMWWMGPKFSDSFQVVEILVVAMTISLMQVIGGNVLMGTSKHKTYALFSLAGAIFNVILSIVLARHLGIFGVALATAIEISILKLCIFPPLIARAIHMSLTLYFTRYFISTVRTLAPLMILFALLKPYILPEFTRILTLVAIQLVLWVPISYYLVLSGNERERIKRALVRRRAGAPKQTGDSASDKGKPNAPNSLH